MRILGIETSCDETAAAVVEDGLRVLGSAVGTQHELHGRFGGVVPEIASRAHIEHVLPVVAAGAGQAGVGGWRISTPWPWRTRPAWSARC